MPSYRFMGCTIKCLGYHQPDHHVIWEAVDDSGNAVAHGKTLRECEFIILEQSIREEYNHDQDRTHIARPARREEEP